MKSVNVRGNVTLVEVPSPGNQCKRRLAMCETLAPHFGLESQKL
jgi:hypothetical protein